jgi:hypothetical protein
MGKAKGKIKIEWSTGFAYAIGLIVTDGCLSKTGRHIDFTSKDLDLVKTFLRSLNIESKISQKVGGYPGSTTAYRVQIGDVQFYRFLKSIGVVQKKSRILGAIDPIPEPFFPDFIRGLFDGDGHFYSYWDPRWKSSFMYYTVFNSASKKHLVWLQKTTRRLYGLKGHTTSARGDTLFSLKYAKKESNSLLKILYYQHDVPCLERKRLKVLEALTIVSTQ